jgi:2',3'-cyclic-nucleotide 2'-phosphodiesterase/3'-nucleotidase
MKHIKVSLAFFILLGGWCIGQPTRLMVVATSDVHGAIFPATNSSSNGMSALSTLVKQYRAEYPDGLILLDNGDLIQGDPASYYYNFINTSDTHLFVRALHYLGYDAATIGNHDIESGPEVYEKFRKELMFPWLGGNVQRRTDDQPWFKPYHIIERQGKRIAILGLTTPAVPQWLPQKLWAGMYFEDMAQSARYWMDIIKSKESPDIVIGLFHSGADTSWRASGQQEYSHENATSWIAATVAGFDLIICGHDHRGWNMKVAGPVGDSVLVLGTTSRARNVALAWIEFPEDKDAQGKPQITGRIEPLRTYAADQAFLEHFSEDIKAVERFVSDTVGWLKDELNSAESIFGPSPFTNLIHRAQMDISGAAISFTAPLSTTARLAAGPVTTGDLFDLYRYENFLYVMDLKGYEIDGFLEHAVNGWFSTMSGPDDTLISYVRDKLGLIVFNYGRPQTSNIYYNFSCAAGLHYTLDLRAPAGSRIEISALSDGSVFYPDSTYQVAINSYRGSGGGGHITKGAGIKPEMLAGRIKWTSSRDLRYLLMDWFRLNSPVGIKDVSNWNIVPEDWYRKAREREKGLWGLK